MHSLRKTDAFGDFPKKYRDPKSAEIAILPVPYDGTSTYGKGADRGPSALLAASYYLENYCLETKSEVYRHGIYVEKPIEARLSPENMVAAVEKKVLEIISKSKFCVMLGGEHSITSGSVRAHARKYKELAILQLDAHTDMRDEYEGSRHNHACTMARVREWKPVQVGIRSFDRSELDNISLERVFFAKDIYNHDRWMEKAISKLKKDVYITIDLDVFDPSLSALRQNGISSDSMLWSYSQEKKIPRPTFLQRN
jgi:agmatinase